MITSAANAPWSCDVIAHLARAGPPTPSVMRTVKIACVEPARIERRAGRLDKATAKAVAQKLVERGFLGTVRPVARHSRAKAWSSRLLPGNLRPSPQTIGNRSSWRVLWVDFETNREYISYMFHN
jgi:hypothetical protein